MNKLISTDLGGFPFALNDIRWQQDATRDAIKGLLSTWGLESEDICILSGCEVFVGATFLNVSEGYISIEGEVYYVPMHDSAIAGGLFGNAWSTEITNDPTGLKTFDSGGSFNTYERREARIIQILTAPSTINYSDVPNIKDKIAESTLDYLTNWVDVGTLNIKTNDDGLGIGTSAALWGSAYAKIRFSKIGKTLSLNLDFNGLSMKDFNDTPAASIVVDIPQSMKPAYTIYSGGIISQCTAAANGAVNKMYSGNIEAHIDPATFNGTIGKLVLSNYNETNTKVYFNREYDFVTTPGRASVAVGLTTVQPTWNFRSSAISYELE